MVFVVQMAIKFMNHKKNASNLPKPSEILSGKVKELKKLEISSKYALTVGMSYELKNIQDEGNEKELTAVERVASTQRGDISEMKEQKEGTDTDKSSQEEILREDIDKLQKNIEENCRKNI